MKTSLKYKFIEAIFFALDFF